MLAHHPVSTLNTADGTLACSHELGLEARVLLQAITALRGAGILSDAEFESKRQRLTARL